MRLRCITAQNLALGSIWTKFFEPKYTFLKAKSIGTKFTIIETKLSAGMLKGTLNKILDF